MHTLQWIRAISHNISKVAETGYTAPDTIIKNVRMHNTTGKPNHIRAHSCTQGGSRFLRHTRSQDFCFPVNVERMHKLGQHDSLGQKLPCSLGQWR